MHKYVIYSCRTLFAGLFLIMGSIRCDDVVAHEALRMISTKYESTAATIEAQPGVYSFNGASYLAVGAPETGYKTAALTRIALRTGDITAIAHKRVIMNNAADQANPLYNQKIRHVCVGAQNCLYVVTEAQPDIVYRYTQYESADRATIHAHKVTDQDGGPCTINGVSAGLSGQDEYVLVQVASRDASKAPGLACVLSHTKLIAPYKKDAATLAAEQRIFAEWDKDKTEEEREEAQKEREIESKKPISKYVFEGFNFRANALGSVTRPLTEFLPQELIDQGSWQISDVQFFDNTFYLEVRLSGTNKHKLLVAKLVGGKYAFVPLGSSPDYYKATPQRQLLSWERRPSLSLSPMSRKKRYCMIVGDLSDSKNSYKSLVAFPTLKNDKAAPMKIGGSAVLPGPISDVKTEHETVYVAVAHSDTSAQPGIFYSQAIFDGEGAISSWSSWQRTAGSSEPVVGIIPSDAGLTKIVVSNDNPHSMRLHTMKWRGRSVNFIETAHEKRMAQEIAQQEIIKEQLAQKKAEREAQLKKAALEQKGLSVPAQETAQAKTKKVEAPETPCYKNGGYQFGKGMTPTYLSSQLQLSYLFETSFDPLHGGARVLIDVPAATDSCATFMIAAGHDRVVIAQTDQKLDKTGRNVLRNYHAAVCENGTISASNIRECAPEALHIRDGQLSKVGFIDFVHVASNGTDTWLCVGGPLGVALLSAQNGKGVPASTGFGDLFLGVTQDLSFKTLGSYQWVRSITSDDQFLYIVTEDVIDRIPLKRSCFKENPALEVCTIATADDVGEVCDGYVFNDVCISQGIIIAATPCGLAATVPGVDCRKVTHAHQVVWRQVSVPTACANISKLVPVSTTGKAQDVACKGQLYVIACSLFDESASITRMYIDKDNIENPIVVVPDIKSTVAGSWLNYVHRINAFHTDGSIHLVGRARFEGRTVDLAKVVAGSKRNSGASQLTFDDNTHQINSIVMSSGSGTVFVAADDGVRIYE